MRPNISYINMPSDIILVFVDELMVGMLINSTKLKRVIQH
jgi:hypothetical protein